MNRVRHRYSVKQCGSLRRAFRPLRVKYKQCIGKRSSSLEDFRPLEFLQFYLRGIKWHNVQRNAGAENFLCRLNVTKNIPFRVRPVSLAIIELAVPAIYRSTHEHHSLQLAERRRIAINRSAQIRFRANSDQRDLTRMYLYLLENEVHRIWVVLVS